MTLVEHHIKYREIHGEDKNIIIMSNGEHVMLHRTLRKQGECNIPVKELAKISRKACLRTEKYKKYYINHLRDIIRYGTVKIKVPKSRLDRPKTFRSNKELLKYIDKRVKERVLNLKC